MRVIKDGAGNVLQRFDYYPFGSESRVWTAGTSTLQSALRYRFGGKEIAGQKVSVSTGAPAAAAGSPYLDFGARVYDPRTAAWLSQDPMAEKYYSISPYAYCAGNPVNLVDPTGEDIWDKLVGFLVGYFTNTIPGTSFVRDWYSPTSSADYNNVLQNIDRAAEVVGNLALTAAAIEGTTGAAMTAAGGGLSASVGGAPEGLAVAGSGAALIAESAKLGVVGTLFKANSKANQARGYERGGTYNGETSKESKSINQLQKDVERGNAPKGIDRFDKGNATLGEKDHVHFKDGSALNIDGTWKHGYRNLKTKEIKYLERNGWKLSK